MQCLALFFLALPVLELFAEPLSQFAMPAN